jgi:2-polyprenyl-6-methoxyphenol hydroxylase-like FAD-dependent oxidoreductase
MGVAAEERTGPTPVLVVGAGPTGLALALSLLRHGVRCRIVDRSPAPVTESRALGVQARTLEVLHAVGVDADMVARGVRVPAGSLHFDGGREARIGFGGLPTAYPYVLILPQSETEAILAARLAAAGVAVERGVEVSGLTQDEDGVTLALGHPDGGREDARGAWVAGCDGAHSTVRQALGVRFEGGVYDERFWLADVRLRWHAPPETLHLFLGRGGLLGVLPLTGGYHRLVLTVPGAHTGDDRTPALAEVERLARAAGPPDLTIEEAIWISSFRVPRRIARRFRVGRVFLAGDAAHVHSPAGGQGMNTGIQDAANLAWKLARVLRGAARDRLLDTYEVERIPVARDVLRGTDALTRMVLLRQPLLRALRDRLLPRLLALAPVQRAVTEQIAELSVRYRSSPIVVQRAATRVRAGDRLPEAHLRDGVRTLRLYDLLADPRHTALWLTAGDRLPGALAADLATRFAEALAVHIVHPAAAAGAFTDPDAGLQRVLGARAATLYVVRPDGYVGLVVSPPDADVVAAYFTRLANGGADTERVDPSTGAGRSWFATRTT